VLYFCLSQSIKSIFAGRLILIAKTSSIEITRFSTSKPITMIEAD